MLRAEIRKRIRAGAAALLAVVAAAPSFASSGFDADGGGPHSVSLIEPSPRALPVSSETDGVGRGAEPAAVPGGGEVADKAPTEGPRRGTDPAARGAAADGRSSGRHPPPTPEDAEALAARTRVSAVARTPHRPDALDALAKTPRAVVPAPFDVVPGGESLALTGNRAVNLMLGKALSVTLPRDVTEVLVSDPKVVDVVVKTPRRAYLLAQQQGDANIFFLDAGGERVLTVDVHVDKDLTALRRALKDLLPAADITATALNGHVVLSGIVASSEVAESARQLALRFVARETEVVNMLRVSRPEQVLIQVRVAEMKRSLAKDLGMSLSGHLNIGSLAGLALSTGSFVSGASVLVPEARGRIAYSDTTPFGTFQSVLDELEKNGYVKTLAEPNLTALSGQEANFLAGGEFPVPTGRDSNGRVTLEFKHFGVALRFQPVVLDGGRISMRIATEVSALSKEGAIQTDGISIPGLMVRRADTAVEIPSGGSLVIGGLLRNDATGELRGLPGAADLPVVGALMRSSEFAREETELVVIAVPYIVRPTAPNELATPVDGFRPADSIENLFLSRFYARHPGKTARQAVEGPVGFVLD